jgi:hypothetical protein
MQTKIHRFELIFLAICFTVAFVPNTSIAGTRCGSDTPAGKIFKDTSADWWPSASLLDFVFIAYTGHIVVTQWAALACAATQGQAYLGDGCAVHDDCYDGKAYPGYTREQCDNVLKNRWIEACNSKYESEWWDFNQRGVDHILTRKYCGCPAATDPELTKWHGDPLTGQSHSGIRGESNV